MAKFCTLCGRPLAEGEVCNCTQQQTQVNNEEEKQEPQQETQNATSNFDFKLYLKTAVDDCIAISKKPVTVGAEFAKAAKTSVYSLFIFLQAIFTAFFAMAICFRIQSSLSDLGSLMSLFGSSKSISFKMVSFKGFILTLLISIILTIILALLIFAANKILQVNLGFQNALAQASIRSVFCVYISIIAIIVSFISPYAGIVLFFSGNIFGVIVISMIIGALATDSNLVSVVMFVVFLVFLIISIIVMSKCWTIYIPSSLKTTMSNIMDIISDPSSLLDSLY